MARNFCLLVFILVKGFSGDFIFSAHISTKNNVVTYEGIFISPLMQKTDTKYDKLVCKLHNKKLNSQTEVEYLNHSQDELFECFVSSGVKIDDSYLSQNSKIRTNTQIFILPIHFQTIYKKGICYVYIDAKS